MDLPEVLFNDGGRFAGIEPNDLGRESSHPSNPAIKTNYILETSINRLKKKKRLGDWSKKELRPRLEDVEDILVSILNNKKELWENLVNQKKFNEIDITAL